MRGGTAGTSKGSSTYTYALEHLTGKKFVHGQLVCLGVYIGSVMQDNQPEEILAAIQRAGVDIRPQAMGITWDDAANALYRLSSFVPDAGLWYTVADEMRVTDALVAQVRDRVEDTFGPWAGASSDRQSDGHY